MNIKELIEKENAKKITITIERESSVFQKACYSTLYLECDVKYVSKGDLLRPVKKYYYDKTYGLTAEV